MDRMDANRSNWTGVHTGGTGGELQVTSYRTEPTSRGGGTVDGMVLSHLRRPVSSR